jgi:hypothetical protein
MTQPRYHLELEAMPGNWQAPPVARLRGLLKQAKRAWGMRCVRVTETPAPEAPRARLPYADD